MLNRKATKKEDKSQETSFENRHEELNDSDLEKVSGGAAKQPAPTGNIPPAGYAN